MFELAPHIYTNNLHRSSTSDSPKINSVAGFSSSPRTPLHLENATSCDTQNGNMSSTSNHETLSKCHQKYTSYDTIDESKLDKCFFGRSPSENATNIRRTWATEPFIFHDPSLITDTPISSFIRPSQGQGLLPMDRYWVEKDLYPRLVDRRRTEPTTTSIEECIPLPTTTAAKSNGS